MGQLLPGFSSEKPGSLVEASLVSSERQGSSSQRPGLSRPGGSEDDAQDIPAERGDGGGDRGDGGGDGRGEQNGGGEVVGGDGSGGIVSEEAGERRVRSREEAAAVETAAAPVAATAWGGHRKEAGEQDLIPSTSVHFRDLDDRCSDYSIFVCFSWKHRPLVFEMT